MGGGQLGAGSIEMLQGWHLQGGISEVLFEVFDMSEENVIDSPKANKG